MKLLASALAFSAELQGTAPLIFLNSCLSDFVEEVVGLVFPTLTARSFGVPKSSTELMFLVSIILLLLVSSLISFLSQGQLDCEKKCLRPRVVFALLPRHCRA